MKPSLQLRAAVYAPKDVVYFKCDGGIGFSPRGLYQESADGALVTSPVTDIAYLGKEEFHPARRTETVKKLQAIAAEHREYAKEYGAIFEDYLQSFAEIAGAACVFAKRGDASHQRLFMGLLVGQIPAEKVMDAMAELLQKIPESEQEAFKEHATKFVANALARELHWRGLSPPEIEKVLNEEDPPEGKMSYFPRLFTEGLGKVAVLQPIAESLFDKVSAAISKERGAPPAVAFTLAVGSMGIQQMGASYAPWQFPDSERARERLLDTIGRLDPTTTPLLTEPFKKPGYTVLMVPDSHVGSVCPRLVDARNTPKGAHHPAMKAMFIGTETPGVEKRSYEHTLGRPEPLFVKNVQFDYMPVARNEITYVTAEEMGHAAFHNVFENKGLPYRADDRASRAAAEALAAQLQERPELQQAMGYAHGFENKELVHKEMAVKGLVTRAVEGNDALRKAWPEMATFVERFVLDQSKKIIQQREGGTGVV